MSLPQTAVPAARSSLAHQLSTRLRPEFTAQVILAAPDDAILGCPPCDVAGCGKGAQVTGLCNAHYVRWRYEGRPERDAWAAKADPGARGHRLLRACAVAGCGRGRSGAGLCPKHYSRWTRLGRPQREAWIAAETVEAEIRPVCAVVGCRLLIESTHPGLCKSHEARWRDAGRPVVDEFVGYCALYGEQTFDLRPLPPPLRLEIAYALQCRVDDNRTRTPAYHVAPLLRFLAASGAASLTDRPAEVWLAEVNREGGWRSVASSFLRYALECVDDVLAGDGWEHEFPRDIWMLHRLGYGDGSRATLRFDRIAQPWLRALVKRWSRWRLSTGLGVSAANHNVAALTRLSVFLAETGQASGGPGELDRAVLESYLAWLSTQKPNPKGRVMELSSVAVFLRTVHQHGWAPALPATAAIYRDDYPRRPQAAPRSVSEHVMAQLESPANLERFADPAWRLLTEILIRTGLRVGDARRLALDCVVHDPGGAPYLSYRNHKMLRDAFVPIDVDLVAAIARQQAAVTQRWPHAVCLFPKATGNPDGQHPVSRSTYSSHLAAWLRDCEVVDELGRPVHVTPHQWRHTYATRLVNAEVPLEVIRRLLDHSSAGMTALYAHLHDRTVREQWERARKVTIAGDEVTFDPTSPLSDAVWLKDQLARAKMALPNGYCTLPLQQHCEYANACLTCPMFITTAEFLPDHRRQLHDTRQLIAQAEQHGHQRMVEMNRTVETNLLRIISALDTAHDAAASDTGQPPALSQEDGSRAS